MKLRTKRKHKPRFRIGSLPIPYHIETRHFGVFASTGSGKTEFLKRWLITSSLRREYGDRCVVVDPGCHFLPAFYIERKDTILNPLDNRCVKWSPLSEIHDRTDAIRLSRSIIPDPPASNDESWYGYARELLSAGLLHVWKQGGNNGNLIDLLTLAEHENELRAACKYTPASTLFIEGNSKMRANAQGVLGPHLATLSHLPRSAGTNDFSIRNWVCHSSKFTETGWLWWPIRLSHIPTLGKLIAIQLAEIVSGILDLPEQPQHRIFVIADEVGQLGRIQAIEQALTLGRKHGLAAILAAQSVSQLIEIYGRESAQVLLSCLSSWIILRAADAETAEAMSRLIGDREVRQAQHSDGETETYGDGHSQRSHSRTMSIQRRVERVFLPSEIQRLPDLDAIVTLAGHSEVAPVKLPLVSPSLPRVTCGFAPHTQPQRENMMPIPPESDSDGRGENSPPSKTSLEMPRFTAPNKQPVTNNIALDDFISQGSTSRQTPSSHTDNLDSPNEPDN